MQPKEAQAEDKNAEPNQSVVAPPPWYKRNGILALMLGFGATFGIGAGVPALLGVLGTAGLATTGVMIPLGIVAVFGIAATIMSIGAFWRSDKSWNKLTRGRKAGRVGKYGLFALMGIVAIVGLGLGIAGLAGASFLASSGIETAGFIGILLVSAAVFAGVIGANVIFAKSKETTANAPIQQTKQINEKDKERPPQQQDQIPSNNNNPINNNHMTQDMKEMMNKMQAQLEQLANENKRLHEDNQKLMQQLNNQRQNGGFPMQGGGGNGFGGGDHYQTKYLAQKIKYEGQLTRQKIDDHLAKETNIFAKYGFGDYMPNNMPPINQRLSPEVLNQWNKQNELQRQLEHAENKIRDNSSSILKLSESGGSSLGGSYRSSARSQSSRSSSQSSRKSDGVSNLSQNGRNS